jgi:hypothetical protein
MSDWLEIRPGLFQRVSEIQSISIQPFTHYSTQKELFKVILFGHSIHNDRDPAYLGVIKVETKVEAEAVATTIMNIGNQSQVSTFSLSNFKTYDQSAKVEKGWCR